MPLVDGFQHDGGVIALQAEVDGNSCCAGSVAFISRRVVLKLNTKFSLFPQLIT
jgi:hypothetical protein